MSQAEKKVKWCLNKAKRELEESDKHRGLVQGNSNLEEAKNHISKAEHYLSASDYLKTGDFSDISASTLFYTIYHSLLAISAKFGYESENQECTFALIHWLAEEGKIDFNKDLLDKIALLSSGKDDKDTIVKIRERFQYGTELEMQEKLYQKMLDFARDVLGKAKVVVEERL